MKVLHRILRILLVCALLLGCLFFLRPPMAQDPDVLQEPTTEPSSEPQPSTTLTPTQPPLDTDALMARIAACIPEEEKVDASFLDWLMHSFGTDVMLNLEQHFLEYGYDRALWYSLTGNSYHVLVDLHSGAADTDPRIRYISQGVPGEKNATTTLIFGGDICLADNYLVMQYLEKIGGSISDGIDPALINIMRDADITFLNNEFTISDRGSPMPGKTYTFRAKTVNTAIYNELGVDIVSLANNHAFDFGQDAFLDTLSALDHYGIAQIGGGKNLADAMKPQYYIINGRKIAFVAATRAEKTIMTPAAGENSPGVLRCYDTALFLQVIREAKANSDYVIACVHWGTEYSYTLEKAQTDSAREYIDAGADLIIGAHAHQLQGIEYYNGKPIFYNLGNFWFNRYDIQTGLAKIELDHNGEVVCTFLPAMQTGCVTSSQIGTELGREIIATLQKYCINVTVDENGLITENP